MRADGRAGAAVMEQRAGVDVLPGAAAVPTFSLLRLDDLPAL